MPLAHYGVLVGELARIMPPEQGRWFQGFLVVRAPRWDYECAVDVATATKVGVEYRVLRDLSRDQFGQILGMSDGYHGLQSDPRTGALDYVRSPLFSQTRHVRRGKARASDARVATKGCTPSDGERAVQELVEDLIIAERVYVFGGRFPDALGMHNIHLSTREARHHPKRTA